MLTLDSPANKNLVDMGSEGVRPSTMPLDLCVAYDADDTVQYWEDPGKIIIRWKLNGLKPLKR